MKILRGNLTETRYAFPEEGEEGLPMKVISENVYKENEVAYMADELGLHRVWNQGSDFAVSLHLYTPPNVAKGGCHIFNSETGKKSHVKNCGYYSAYGKRLWWKAVRGAVVTTWLPWRQGVARKKLKCF
jgi:hypothetical protein